MEGSGAVSYLGAFFIGMAAFWLARGVGLPVWRLESGDALEIAFFAGLGALLITRAA